MHRGQRCLQQCHRCGLVHQHLHDVFLVSILVGRKRRLEAPVSRSISQHNRHHSEWLAAKPGSMARHGLSAGSAAGSDSCGECAPFLRRERKAQGDFKFLNLFSFPWQFVHNPLIYVAQNADLTFVRRDERFRKVRLFWMQMKYRLRLDSTLFKVDYFFFSLSEIKIRLSPRKRGPLRRGQKQYSWSWRGCPVR